MAATDTTAFHDFDGVSHRLDEIVEQVRDKGTSLERSLDLFDEAIALGSRAVELVDKVDFSAEEQARMSDAAPQPAAGAKTDAAPADTTPAE